MRRTATLLRGEADRRDVQRTAPCLPLVQTLLDRAYRTVWSHGRFRHRGTEYLSVSGMEWMSVSTKRQCDRGLSRGPWRHLPAGRAALSTDQKVSSLVERSGRQENGITAAGKSRPASSRC